ncbi:MAG: Clp protease ClpP, partial [Porphyrobacter sp.]|nr:Clp protease ClpP [Porphyrobacter sp.]
FEVEAAADRPTITIFDAIGEGFGSEGVTPARIAGALRTVAGKPITVEINSPGGNYFDGVAIYNLLRRHDADVTVQVLGIAASAASIIAMAGDRIEIAHNAEIMIHQARGLFFGTADEMADAMATLQKLDGAMADTYAARTGMKRDALLSMMKAETYIGGQDAVDMKFADAVMEREAQPIAYAEADDLPSDIASLDRLLAKQGMSRAKRRDLYREIKGRAPEAAPADTPSAADQTARLLRALQL